MHIDATRHVESTFGEDGRPNEGASFPNIVKTSFSSYKKCLGPYLGDLVVRQSMDFIFSQPS